MNGSATEIAIGVAGVAAAIALLRPRVANSSIWRATVTPLASIIGSGFLILGPILVENFGSWAALAMALLCFAGYAFGAAIRFNIAHIDGPHADDWWVDAGEQLASWALAFAYIISVAYYLNLFGAFAARIFLETPGLWRAVVATAVYAVILAAGIGRGFGLLERLEQWSVSIKLVIIAGMIAGLAVATYGAWQASALVQSPVRMTGIAALQMMFGLIVAVQGFETSRYLGHHYPATERRWTMLLAQAIATVIYIVYVGLLSLNYRSGSFTLDETAIIDLMAGIAAILGPLLLIAALSAQFSAAVADTVGAGGLFTELSRGRVSARVSYVLLVAVGVALTWTSNVFEIVSYASRAFSFYYGVQAALACSRSFFMADGRWPRGIARTISFAALALLGFAATILATPVEGS